MKLFFTLLLGTLFPFYSIVSLAAAPVDITGHYRVAGNGVVEEARIMQKDNIYFLEVSGKGDGWTCAFSGRAINAAQGIVALRSGAQEAIVTFKNSDTDAGLVKATLTPQGGLTIAAADGSTPPFCEAGGKLGAVPGGLAKQMEGSASAIVLPSNVGNTNTTVGKGVENDESIAAQGSEEEKVKSTGYGKKLHAIAFDISFGMTPAQVKQIVEAASPEVFSWEEFISPHTTKFRRLYTSNLVIDDRQGRALFIFTNDQLVSIRYHSFGPNLMDAAAGGKDDSTLRAMLNFEASKAYGKPIFTNGVISRYLVKNTHYVVVGVQDNEYLPLVMFQEKKWLDAILEEERRVKAQETAKSAKEKSAPAAELSGQNSPRPTNEELAKVLNAVLKNNRGNFYINKELDSIFFNQDGLTKGGKAESYICYKSLEKSGLLSMEEKNSRPSFGETQKSYAIKVMPQYLKTENEYSYYVRLADVSVKEIVRWDSVTPKDIEVWFTRNIDHVAPWITADAIGACPQEFGKYLAAYMAGQPDMIRMRFIDGSHPRWEINIVYRGGTL